MSQLTSTEWLVLNSTADDAENLEQIYRSLALERCADPDHPGDPSAYCWRESQPRILLSEIADAIHSLVARGLLVPRRDPARELDSDELSDVWRAWFEMTEQGRSLWMVTTEPSNLTI
jgi:hypothetical protein